MFAPFHKILSPPEHLAFEQKQRYKVLQVSFAVTVVGGALLGWLNLLQGVQSFAIVLFACSLSSLLGLYLNHRGRHQLSAAFLALQIYAAILFAIIDGGGLSDPGVAAFPILILISGLILGRKGVFGSLGGAVGSITALYILYQNRILVLNSEPDLNRVIVLTTLFVMTAAVVWVLLDTWGKSFAERARTAARLRESEARYRTLATATFEGIVISQNGVIIDANEQFAAMNGYTQQELIGMCLVDLLPSEEQNRSMEASAKGDEWVSEFDGVRRDGSRFFAEAHGQAYEKDNQSVWITTIRDITDRKRAEEALRKSNEQFSKAFHSSAAGLLISTFDEDRIMDANETMLNMFGFHREEFVGHTSFELGLWDDPRDRDTLMAMSGQTGNLRLVEARFRTKDRRLLICSSSFQSIILDGVRCIIATIMDISEQKQSEEKLRLEAARSNALARVAARLNAQLDMDKVLESICQEIVAILNVPSAAVLLYDHQKDVCALAAEYGLPHGFRKQFQPIPGDTFLYPLGARDPVFVPNLQSYPDLVNAGLYADVNIRSILFIGMYHKERFVGVVDLYCQDKTRTFREDEMLLLKALTDLGVQAIVNANLYRDVSEGHEHLRLVSQQLVEIQEAERRSLALELHDELGQVLNGIKISLDMIPIVPDPAAREQLLSKARTAISGLIEQVRQMSLDLRPSMLDEMGLLPTLKWFFRGYQEQTGTPVRFQWEGPDQRLPPSIEITAYRIIQEALNNVIRHASNKDVSVTVCLNERSLDVRMEDQGGGFDPQLALRKGKSTGLSGMRERARLLGGELNVESTIGIGTTILANIPLPAP